MLVKNMDFENLGPDIYFVTQQVYVQILPTTDRLRQNLQANFANSINSGAHFELKRAQKRT